MSMRRIRQYSLFYKVVFCLGLLCVVAAIAIHTTLGGGWLIYRPMTAAQNRWDDISMNLLTLGLVYSAFTNAYARRDQAHPPNLLPLDSMRKQGLAVLLFSAAPLFAITLAVVISPKSEWYAMFFVVSLVGWVSMTALMVNNLSLSQGAIPTRN